MGWKQQKNEKLPGDLQVPARREGAGEAEGVGEQGNAHGQVEKRIKTSV